MGKGGGAEQKSGEEGRRWESVRAVSELTPRFEGLTDDRRYEDTFLETGLGRKYGGGLYGSPCIGL